VGQPPALALTVAGLLPSGTPVSDPRSDDRTRA
jgi:hypothetical protein